MGRYNVSAADPEDKEAVPDTLLPGVVFNMPDTYRMNGTTWLDSIHTILVPYLLQAEEGAIVIKDYEPDEAGETILMFVL